MLAFLAFHRETPIDRFREEFYPTHSAAAADNGIAKVRRLVGVDESGESRLVTDRERRCYIVGPDIGCDWTRFTMLVDQAIDASPDAAIELLSTALELVDGVPGASMNAEAANYEWLREDPINRHGIEVGIVDAARSLGELALEAGEPTLADWAANQALAVLPADESLWRLKMEVSGSWGDLSGVRASYQAAQRAAKVLDPDAEVENETLRLFERLCAGE